MSYSLLLMFVFYLAKCQSQSEAIIEVLANQRQEFPIPALFYLNLEELTTLFKIVNAHGDNVGCGWRRDRGGKLMAWQT